ncbi:hypothetical protein HPP92_008125 [Vanilla planifolia]|uniref:Uncharacterized protein n=1 Tax=Vanilla planifolia TaxID=51239 RepID=A0A835RDK0_VANPL|nr:hypothetical protein HPP92_008125 [Vanilla planifolia]
MALKRATHTWPSVQCKAPTSRRVQRSLQNVGREPAWSAKRGKVPCERHLHMGWPILRDGGNPSDSAIWHELRKGVELKFSSRDVAVDGNVKWSGDVGGGPGKSYLFA